MASIEVNPGDVLNEAVKGAGFGALAIGAWTLLKTFAVRATMFLEGTVAPALLPAAAVGGAIFGLLSIIKGLFPAKK